MKCNINNGTHAHTKSFSLPSSNNKEIAWPDAILTAVESDPNKVCRIENCLQGENAYSKLYKVVIITVPSTSTRQG